MRRRVACVLGLALAAACAEHLPRAFEDSAPPALPVADAALDVEAPTDGDGEADAAVDDATADASQGDAADADGSVLGDGGACNVRLAAPPLVDSPHVPEGTDVVYTSNPPSSGPHYPVWANFEVFDHPVADPYLVHSLEHGAVELLYKCDDPDAGACADVVAQLRALVAAVPTDPICDPAIRVRMIVAPRPANDVPIAAAAWGYTYRADCVDGLSLAAFIAAHYGQGPEQLCFQGGIF